MLPTRGGKEEFVSSRAPVWGASSLDLLVGLIRESFKSCPRVGGIPSASVGRNYQKLFQVVPPCGGHPISSCVVSLSSLSFKSCPRVGGIQQRRRNDGRSYRFQVVPPCGGHQLIADVLGADKCFKSCPRVGGISCFIDSLIAAISFKSCPRVGGICNRFG